MFNLLFMSVYCLKEGFEVSIKKEISNIINASRQRKIRWILLKFHCFVILILLKQNNLNVNGIQILNNTYAKSFELGINYYFQ